MSFARRAIILAVTAAVAVLAGVDRAGAQARPRQRIGRVGELSRPGTSSSVGKFQRYSYGLGGLRGARGGASTNVLSRQMTRSGSRIQRSSGAGLPTGPNLPSSPGVGPSAVRRYSVPSATIKNLGGTGSALSLSEQDSLGAAFAYLDTLSRGADEELLKAQSGPITSLVPETDSAYADYMREAEEDLRNGRYHDAIGNYKLANHIGRTDPESFLGMAHARIGLSGGHSYSTAAYNLAQALKYFPELPMVSLRPRAFFPSENEYAKVVTQVRQRLDRNPRNAEAQFVLAYLRWFDGDAEAAVEALDMAARHSSKPDFLEAVETFRDGIDRVRSGGQPEATTRPAEGEGTPAVPGPSAAGPSE
jgi:hypothetical protein